LDVNYHSDTDEETMVRISALRGTGGTVLTVFVPAEAMDTASGKLRGNSVGAAAGLVALALRDLYPGDAVRRRYQGDRL
jgi:hypothetical protein